VGQYVTVALLPDDPKSTILHVMSGPDMTRKAVIEAVGQGVPDLQPGQTVLCRPLQGHYIGDLLLLPHAAVIATVDDEC
jgi:hypothetical protein